MKFSVAEFFWLEKFGNYFLGWLELSRDSWWCPRLPAENTDINFYFIFRVISFNTLWKVLRLGNSAWDFFGGQSSVQGCFGVLLEALGFLGGFDFCPIRSSPSLEICSTPTGIQTESNFPCTSQTLLFYLDYLKTPDIKLNRFAFPTVVG